MSCRKLYYIILVIVAFVANPSEPVRAFIQGGGAKEASCDNKNTGPDKVLISGRGDVSGARAGSRERGVLVRWEALSTDENTEFIVSRSGVASSWYEEIYRGALEGAGSKYSYIDRGAEPGGSYSYMVETICGGGRKVIFTSERIEVGLKPAHLYQNSPNPFNPSTMIRFHVYEEARVTVEVFDAEGRSTVRLLDAKKERGEYTVIWDGFTGYGEMASSGVYFCRINADGFTETRRMVLLR